MDTYHSYLPRNLHITTMNGLTDSYRSDMPQPVHSLSTENAASSGLPIGYRPVTSLSDAKETKTDPKSPEQVRDYATKT